MGQVDTARWPFDVPPETAVVTTAYITRDRMRVVYVSHELDEEEGVIWQFHCGLPDFGGDVLQLVRLDEILAIDPSLSTIAHLPVGYSAQRSETSDDWDLQKIEDAAQGS